MWVLTAQKWQHNTNPLQLLYTTIQAAANQINVVKMLA
jgi:hypothetical protein